MHRPLAIASVGALVFPGDAVLTWPASPGALAYRTYRGTIGALDGWPAGTAYDHTCCERDDALGDGELLTTDPTIPAAGRFTHCCAWRKKI